MAKIISLARWVRNNWKKTVFFSTVSYYGGDFIKTEYEKNSLVRLYCKEAVKYGEVPLPVFQSPRHILVILNPTANKKKAKKEYDKYCAPLLHLSGAKVTLLNTTDEHNATTLGKVGITEDIDALIVAGGDGTISEVLTGIFYAKNNNEVQKEIPIGIIPVGKNNNIAKTLYWKKEETLNNDSLNRVKLMMDATFSIVRELTSPQSVIETKKFLESEESFKPTYSLGYLQWGAFRDTHEKIDKYWYFGAFRQFAAYLFNSQFNTPFQMDIKYTSPCAGCSRCYKYRLDLAPKKEKIENKRWWHAFAKRSPADPKVIPVNYEKINNENCDNIQEKSVQSVELIISQKVVNGVPSLRLQIGPESLSYINFVKEGWSRGNSYASSLNNEEIYAQNVYVIPPIRDQEDDEKKTLFSIDNEVRETIPIKISLLHKVLPVFTLNR